MSTNSAADQQVSSVFDGLPELLRDLRRELLPRVPWRAAALWGVALGGTFMISRGVAQKRFWARWRRDHAGDSDWIFRGDLRRGVCPSGSLNVIVSTRSTSDA